MLSYKIEHKRKNRTDPKLRKNRTDSKLRITKKGKNMDKDEIEDIVSTCFNNPLVVKPRNTNYGTGITVFSKTTSKKQIITIYNIN